MRSPLLAAALALPLAACISFGAKPPPTLMTLSNASPLAPGQSVTAREGTSITIYVPSAPPELGGLRVPVKAGPNAVAYLKDAQWGDAPTRLFRNLLAETITAKTGRVALDPRQYVLAPGARLSGRLVDFGMDAGTGQVTATYDAMLVRKEGATLESRRFQAKAQAATQDAPGVAAALSQASNQIAAEVADWVGAG
ncbi:ABC-type transport auxiliary lipoprotein family protein [Sphingomonas quercus]|nr:ABC-type transport auxiliary lipoprotein family protein [Sphingomonas quercus]